MASLIYDSFWDDLAKGNIDLDSDTFKIMLVTSSYTAVKGTDAKRSDVTNEVSGTGYSAGGTAQTVTPVEHTTDDQEIVTFSGVSWSTATITARGAVIYKSRGGASSADNLVCYIDFGSNIISTAGTFALSASTITLQN